MKIIYLSFLSIIIFLGACVDPAANKPKAQTAEPVLNVTPQTVVGTENITKFKTTGTGLAITPMNSKIEFTGSKVTGRHEGGFKAFNGVIDLVENKAESSKVVIDPAKGPGNFTVTGDLTMRGVTKSVTFPSVIAVNATGAIVKTEFSINRKDFGIAYAGKADDLIRDDVVIKLDLDAKKK